MAKLVLAASPWRGGLEGAVGQHLAAFHAHRLAALGRQRQREIAQTAEQVGDAVGGLHFQQVSARDTIERLIAWLTCVKSVGRYGMRRPNSGMV